MTIDYGVDFDCLEDCADDFRMLAGDDPETVMQDVYHRLTTEDLLDVEGWGIDVRKMLESAQTQQRASALQPLIDSVIQRDDRVLSSETTCTLEPGDDPNDAHLIVAIRAQLASGPFDLVLQVSEVTVSILQAVPPIRPPASTAVEIPTS